MVEAVSSKPSAFKGILATTAIAGVLNAGVQAGYELYNVKTAPKKFMQEADKYLKEAVKAEATGKKSLSEALYKNAEDFEKAATKGYKFNWKNVGRGALWGAIATAVLCTALHGLGAIFCKK